MKVVTTYFLAVAVLIQAKRAAPVSHTLYDKLPLGQHVEYSQNKYPNGAKLPHLINVDLSPISNPDPKYYSYGSNILPLAHTVSVNEPNSANIQQGAVATETSNLVYGRELPVVVEQYRPIRVDQHTPQIIEHHRIPKYDLSNIEYISGPTVVENYKPLMREHHRSTIVEPIRSTFIEQYAPIASEYNKPHLIDIEHQRSNLVKQHHRFMADHTKAIEPRMPIIVEHKTPVVAKHVKPAPVEYYAPKGERVPSPETTRTNNGELQQYRPVAAAVDKHPTGINEVRPVTPKSNEVVFLEEKGIFSPSAMASAQTVVNVGTNAAQGSCVPVVETSLLVDPPPCDKVLIEKHVNYNSAPSYIVPKSV